ncbi:MAG: hypothetical protein ACRDHW_23655, partial [Ktedonobacteraceae bacterium]
RKAAFEQTLASVEKQIANQRRLFKAEIMRMLERNAKALQVEECSWIHFEAYVEGRNKREILEEIADE